MHVRLFNELLCRREPREPVAKSAIVAWAPTASGHVATHSELENILWAAVDNYDWWSASHLFKELATKTQNATVHYTAYKVLWRKLTANKLQYDPTNLWIFMRR
ncbi:unnamed protein product [Ceratitis capitata]|uniref:(Mediterranean fruit fly) hypothetical protein n=1 Tax=Ceratitis capitata TaxID=7213 RepID=A0A811UTR8_CERCA|nr:unnamed protein product [Ceratitis capitata]